MLFRCLFWSVICRVPLWCREIASVLCQSPKDLQLFCRSVKFEFYYVHGWIYSRFCRGVVLRSPCGYHRMELLRMVGRILFGSMNGSLCVGILWTGTDNICDVHHCLWFRQLFVLRQRMCTCLFYVTTEGTQYKQCDIALDFIEY